MFFSSSHSSFSFMFCFYFYTGLVLLLPHTQYCWLVTSTFLLTKLRLTRRYSSFLPPCFAANLMLYYYITVSFLLFAISVILHFSPLFLRFIKSLIPVFCKNDVVDAILMLRLRFTVLQLPGKKCQGER